MEAKRIRGMGLGMIMSISPRTASWLSVATATIEEIFAPCTKRVSLRHALKDPDTRSALVLEETVARLNDAVKAKKLTFDQRELEADAINARMIASLSMLFDALLAASSDHQGRADTHEAAEYEFMTAAIDEARKSKMEPNKTPLYVGAVIVKAGRIIARGHRGQHKLGEHAEYTTLERNLTEPGIAANATLYCTLEPCTVRNNPKSPCVEWIKRHKISRVVIGVIDPNREIRGGGVKLLRQAGIDVQLFPHMFANEIEALNSAFESEHEQIDARHRRPAISERIQPSTDMIVVGMSRHEVTKIGHKIDALVSAQWTPDLIAAIHELLPYAESRNAELSFDILSILSSVAAHARFGMTPAAARAIWHVATYALPAKILVRRADARISAADLRVLLLGCELGEGLAYDAGLYLRDLVVLDAGAAILSDVLRYANICEHTELERRAEQAFDLVKDATERGSFNDGLRWLEFKRADSLANDTPPRMPDDLASRIYPQL